MTGIKFWIFFIIWCFLAFVVLIENVYVWGGDKWFHRYLRLFFKKKYKSKQDQDHS